MEIKTELSTRSMGLKGFQIPLIKEPLTVYETGIGEFKHFWIGVTHKDDSYEAAEKLLGFVQQLPDHKYIIHFDFQNNTEIGARKWSVHGRFNFYENTSTTAETALISGECTGFERIYLYTADLHQ